MCNCNGKVTTENWCKVFNITAERQNLFSLDINLTNNWVPKDITNFNYIFRLAQKTWTQIYQKDLIKIDNINGNIQLTITTNDSIDEWVGIPVWDYNYEIEEEITSTWDKTTLLKGSFTVLETIINP